MDKFEKYPRSKEDNRYMLSFHYKDYKDYIPILEKYGLVVINVLPKKQCENTIKSLFQEVNKNNGDKIDRYNPKTWYSENWPSRSKFLTKKLALTKEAFKNRTSPQIHYVFSKILKTEKLWCTIDHWGIMRGTKNLVFADKNNVIIENRPDWKVNLRLHFDLDPWYYIKELKDGKCAVYQGVLALDDCCEEVGGFCCVPCSAPNLEKWCFNNKPKHSGIQRSVKLDPNDPLQKRIQRIPLKQGEMVIWNSGTAHCNFSNNSDRMRLVQYISMMPAEEDSKIRNNKCPIDMLDQIKNVDFDKIDLSEREKKVLSLIPY